MGVKAAALEESSARNDVASFYKHLWHSPPRKIFHLVWSTPVLISCSMQRWRVHISQLVNALSALLDPDIKAAAELTHSMQNDPGESTQIHRDVKTHKGNQAARICGVPVELLSGI